MDFRSTIKNFASLSALQAINYITPLIMLPYIIKVIGIDNFGISNYTLSLFIFFKVFIDYGYNLSGVKQIAENKSNEEAVSKIFSKIFFVKIYLLVISVVVLLILTSVFPFFQKEYSLLLLSFFVVIGQTLLPTWFYQAIERAEILVIGGVISRIIYLCLIFFFIQRKEHYILINFFLGIADCFLAVFSIVYAIFKYNIKVKRLFFSAFLYELKTNFQFAKSNGFVTMALSVPYFTLGYFANNTVLGYYGVADKIIQIFRTSAGILHSATFPRVVILFNKSREEFIFFVKKLYSFIVVGYVFILVFCLSIPNYLIELFTNSLHADLISVQVLCILSCIPLIAALDLLPTHLLLLKHREKKYASILLIASSFGIFSSIALCYFFNYLGAAISYLSIELLIFILLIISTKNDIKNIFTFKSNLFCP